MKTHLKTAILALLSVIAASGWLQVRSMSAEVAAMREQVRIDGIAPFAAKSNESSCQAIVMTIGARAARYHQKLRELGYKENDQLFK